MLLTRNRFRWWEQPRNDRGSFSDLYFFIFTGEAQKFTIWIFVGEVPAILLRI